MLLAERTVKVNSYPTHFHVVEKVFHKKEQKEHLCADKWALVALQPAFNRIDTQNQTKLSHIIIIQVPGFFVHDDGGMVLADGLVFFSLFCNLSRSLRFVHFSLCRKMNAR